jgi:hypothetical protein
VSMSVTTSTKQMRLTGFFQRIQDLHQAPWNELHVGWLRACKRIASEKAPPVSVRVEPLSRHDTRGNKPARLQVEMQASSLQRHG